jgi:hypothetical protein
MNDFLDLEWRLMQALFNAKGANMATYANFKAFFAAFAPFAKFAFRSLLD